MMGYFMAMMMQRRRLTNTFTASGAMYFNNYSLSASAYGIYFKGTIRRRAASAMTLWQNLDGSGYGWRLGLDASGHLTCYTSYSGGNYTSTTVAVVPLNAWTEIEIYGLNNNTTLYMRIGTGTAESFTQSNRFYTAVASVTMSGGNASLDYRGTIEIRGVSSNQTTGNTAIFNIDTASVGSGITVPSTFANSTMTGATISTG